MLLDTIKHYPVMINEVLSFIQDNKTVVDCTFGGGGYSSRILREFKTTNVIGLDRDKNILNFASELKDKYSKRFNFYNIKFSQIYKLNHFQNNDFFIFDLGLSNFQLKNMKRSFSFDSEDALDMTMGLNTLNASDLINRVSENDLKRILKFFGNEKFASQISRKILKHRDNEQILSGKSLSNIINSVKYKKNKINPSTKSFQAIRMVVNQELSEIYKSLNYIIRNCKEGAVIIVVTFHSLEDLLVKRLFNFYGKKKSLSRYIPKKTDIDNICIDILTNKAVKPSVNEIKKNPNSRSAKLRVIKKIKNPNIELKREDLNMEKYFTLEELYV
tara:strand:- start:9062 stop:10051 length:990 start_codon:yes stop_codon:yes gene_type:complete